MRSSLKNKNLMTNIMSLAAFLLVLFGASCSDNNFIPSDEDNSGNTVVEDSILSFSDFKLNEEAWSYSNGLATANDHYFDGYVEYKVDGQVVKSDLIEHENAPMSISWDPIKEDTTVTAEKMYLGSSASEAKFIDSKKNQKVTFKKYERECTLKFVGMEVVLKGSWYEASLGNNSKAVGCRYEKTTVATQEPDTAMVNGIKEEIIVNGKKYNRVTMTAKAENHFTDLPAGEPHTEAMDIQYSVLVPVVFTPGEKIYQGSASVEGTGSYTKVSETEYKSQIDLTHYFIQDGKTSTEQETVSGLATVKTWVETAGNKLIVPSIEIGNPSVNVSTSVSEDFYQKEGYIYAKMYKTTWTYTWSNGFQKKVYSEVERLYYRREAGKEVAMPYGETSTSFSNFNAGNSVEKSENGKKYNAYPEGIVSFSGSHKSTTGNVNDQIAGLSVGQEFWVEVVEEDKFIDFDYKVIKGDKDNASQIIITEHWSVSGDKEITFTQNANYSFTVSGQQRVFGESLSFTSGLEKSTDATGFNKVKENQYVSTVTDTYTAKFNPDCDVKAIAGYIKAYVEYRGKKIDFQFATATVEYKGINNPTATEVEADGKLYSRRSYEVTFAHNLLGNKVASVLVDKEINLDPSTPDEWGTLDIEKTKNYGGICISWEKVGNTFKPFYSGTVITSKGIVSFKNGYQKFTAMNTNSINNKVGNAWDGANLYPAYITVDKSAANLSWAYNDVTTGTLLTDVHSSKMEVEGGFDMEQPFVANGGQANVYEISENGNVVRVVVTFNGETMFNEVFAK